MSTTSGKYLAVKSFKDPLYGYVDIYSVLSPVIDSPLFQRLRWVKQTAFANLVYHGMEHSRFTHSLGVAHLAGEVVSTLGRNTVEYFQDRGSEGLAKSLLEGRAHFQLASLLHDAGHLPYSHASEVGVFDAVVFLDYGPARRLPLSHEEYTRSLVPYFAGLVEKDLEPLTGSSLEEDILAILGQPLASHKNSLGEELCAISVYNSLIAGGIDIDRMDYLHRDSLHAGVSYGRFDVDRLLRMLLAVPRLNSGYDCTTAVLDKGLTVVETFLLARFYMFSEVYLHRVVETYNSFYARLFALLMLNDVIGPMDRGGEIRIPLPDELREGDEEALEQWVLLDDLEITRLYRRVARGYVRLREHRWATRRLAQILSERGHPRTYRAFDDEKLWASYRAFLEKVGEYPGAPVGIYEELVELQRENPEVIVRPLNVDLKGLKSLRVYDRVNGMVTDAFTENGLDEYRGVIDRVRKLAEIGIYRVIIVSATKESDAYRRAIKLVHEAIKEIRRSEKR